MARRPEVSKKVLSRDDKSSGIFAVGTLTNYRSIAIQV